MYRFLFALAVLAFAMPASLAQAKAETISHVYGDATVAFPDVTIHDTFDVRGNPQTFVASGFYRQHVFGEGFDIDFTGTVDCLNVVGNTAYLSGILTASNRPDIAVGSPFYTSMTDASPDGTGDMVGGTYLNSPYTCLSIIPPEFLVTSGNVVIQQCDRINGSDKCKAKDE
jgi:hypothetical protein